ncbi:low molecular weight protein arginine phosphatase [Gaopeijia maritima]|uniref:protein-tyrosine-phosphatase n=1 Tax=Gaopeijia maritima TaxID=3119007 RepID=A0ABU9EBZ5_9BACT
MNAPSPFRIVFVCTGNTCRSPLAEALARREIERRGWGGVEVASAGVAAHPGAPASGGSQRVGEEAGLDLSQHRARLLDSDMVDRADLVLTMGEHHAFRVMELGGEGRVDLLTRFAGAGAEGVPDPFGADDAIYRRTLEVLDRLVGVTFDRLAPILDP